MIYVVAAVYDSKARAYLPPNFCSTQEVAARAFANAANTPGTPIGENPEDFIMFIVGTWDDSTAEFTLYAERINLGLAANYVRSIAHVRSQKSSQSVRNEALVRKGAKGGNSTKHV